MKIRKKFRVWEKGNRSKNDIHYFTIPIDDKECTKSTICFYPGDIVEQYTGFRAITGEEIYEGDIIQGFNNRKYAADKSKLSTTGYMKVTIPEIYYLLLYGDIFEPNSGVWIVGNSVQTPHLLYANKGAIPVEIFKRIADELIGVYR